MSGEGDVFGEEKTKTSLVIKCFSTEGTVTQQGVPNRERKKKD